MLSHATKTKISLAYWKMKRYNNINRLFQNFGKKAKVPTDCPYRAKPFTSRRRHRKPKNEKSPKGLETYNGKNSLERHS